MRLANPTELLSEPERAMIEILDAVLQQTIFALLAAHLEVLGQEPFHESPGISKQALLADVICEQASSLQHTLERYRQVGESEREDR